MPKLRITVGGTVISLALGLLVFALALGIAWRNYRGAYGFQWKQASTRARFRQIDKGIEAFRRERGALPRSLADLDPQKHLGIDSGDRGPVLDGWQHPLHYTVEGGFYEVVSYGRDGRPGGVGLDFDVSNTDPWPPEALPTLGQFLFEMPSRGMILTCAAAGLATCLIAFMWLGAPDTARKPAATFLACLGLTAIGALIAAVLISALHIPSGH